MPAEAISSQFKNPLQLYTPCLLLCRADKGLRGINGYPDDEMDDHPPRARPTAMSSSPVKRATRITKAVRKTVKPDDVPEISKLQLSLLGESERLKGLDSSLTIGLLCIGIVTSQRRDCKLFSLCAHVSRRSCNEAVPTAMIAVCQNSRRLKKTR